MSDSRQPTIKVAEGELCDPPHDGLRWVEVELTLPVPTATEDGQSSQTAPILTSTATLRFPIPAVAKGSNIEAAAYLYGQMAASHANAVLKTASAANPTDPSKD